MLSIPSENQLPVASRGAIGALITGINGIDLGEFSIQNLQVYVAAKILKRFSPFEFSWKRRNRKLYDLSRII